MAKAWAWAKAWVKAEANAPRKLIVPGFKGVDAIERSDGKVIGQARDRKERDVVPGPLLDTVCEGDKEA